MSAISLSDLLAALMLGVVGSSHCVFMCGGIHAALITSSDNGRRLMPLFNLGRVTSYTFFGLLAGSVGFALQSSHNLLLPVAKLLAGFLLLAMAAYVGRWWQGLTVLERLGAPIWTVIQPFAKQLMPVQSLSGAFAAGALWGWLPCGLVYSTLAWAMLAESPVNSASRMFFFGLGTLPALLGSGWMASTISSYLKTRFASNLNAILLVIFALWTMYPSLKQFISPEANGHQHHGHTPVIEHTKHH